MPNTVNVQNNFVGGLKTEFTGLNFPENAATDTDNCIYTIVGDVLRREGIDYEQNFAITDIERANKAFTTYKWTNAGGDSTAQILVIQIGGTIYFYKYSAATIASPLSTTLIGSVNLTPFFIVSNPDDFTQNECQFSDGNGYLFVFHRDCSPFYVSYINGVFATTAITIQIRDTRGIPENAPDISRPVTASTEHAYNLLNQGWTNAPGWTANSTDTVTYGTGAKTFTVQAGLPVIIGSQVSVSGYAPAGNMTPATVTAYAGTSLTLNVTSVLGGGTCNLWVITPINTSTTATFSTALGIFPSNCDVWWLFKDAAGLFAPATKNASVIINSPAPKGHFVIDALNQRRSVVSGQPGLNDVVTVYRPTVGTWYLGRVWYTGINASQAAIGDQAFYTWTERIYFSQIADDVSKFGRCYEQNDPTDENLFDLLSTDGGEIVIQGSGPIYKLFPIQNGLLVFAANGIWFITGSQGIGFSATDYTITKISGVQNISGTSYVNVSGYPVFWNEEGIYSVEPDPHGGLAVNNLCIGTILSFYSNISLLSKKFARGDYNQVDYEVQWCYRNTNETDITSRYNFDRILVYNTVNKAFYTYSLSGSPHIHGINYIVGPGGGNSPPPTFKYVSSVFNPATSHDSFTFAEERDATHYRDWFSYDNVGVNYTSYFVTGFRIAGKALMKWQPQYVYMFLRGVPNSYKIQGIWDYASSGNSGKFSTIQIINNTINNFNMLYRRHKIRGHGLVLQIKIGSVDGKPFDIMGWSALEQVNQGM